jgi:hypothetical protein
MAYKLSLDEIKEAFIVEGGNKSKVDKRQLERSKELVNKRLENVTDLDNLPSGGHIANCDVYAIVRLLNEQDQKKQQPVLLKETKDG